MTLTRVSKNKPHEELILALIDTASQKRFQTIVMENCQ